jgi:hypothetical protein
MKKIIVAYTDKKYLDKVGEIKNAQLIPIDLNKEDSYLQLRGINKEDIKTFWLSPGSKNGKYYNNLKKEIEAIYSI